MKKFAKLAAVVASAIMAFGVASADYTIPDGVIKPLSEDGNGTVYLWKDEVDKKTEEVTGKALYTNADELKTLTGIKFTITCPQAATLNAAGDGNVWYGGAYGVNSSLNNPDTGKAYGWNAPQWCVNEETTSKTMATKINDTTYEVVFKFDGSTLTQDDYIRTVFQSYGPADTTFKVTLLGVDAPGSKKADTNTNTNTETDTGKKATDSNAKTGDATSVAALAAVAALAMVGVVVTSKKKEA